MGRFSSYLNTMDMHLFDTFCILMLGIFPEQEGKGWVLNVIISHFFVT